MPLIWCSISGHGFGHAAQVVPVLNALARRVKGLTAVLRTTVPPWFFDQCLNLPWEISGTEQDIGCVQRGPLIIDYPATMARHLQFLASWRDRVAEEQRAMRERQPTLVLTDISWLASAAAAGEQIPAVALSNLSWDQVLEPYITKADQEHHAMLAHIRAGYAHAHLMLRLAPGLPMPAFSKVIDVGPVAQDGSDSAVALHQILKISAHEQIVLVGFGGIALDTLPFDRMEQMAGYHFLISGTVPVGLHRCHAIESLAVPFNKLLASADVIMTKPGYSTIIDAVTRHRPVLYVRRYNFADEGYLVQYLHRYGRGVELSAEGFSQGLWEKALHDLHQTPAPVETPPTPTGAVEAAIVLSQFF